MDFSSNDILWIDNRCEVETLQLGLLGTADAGGLVSLGTVNLGTVSASRCIYHHHTVFSIVAKFLFICEHDNSRTAALGLMKFCTNM